MNNCQRTIEYVEITELKPAPRNPRTHSRDQIRRIGLSISRHGFNSPVLVDDSNSIIAGHGRVTAAREIGPTLVPCIRISGMTDAEKRAYVIADNKLAMRAGWDMEMLAIEFQGLMDSGFDVALTGFELPEIDSILIAAADSSPEPVRSENYHPQPSTDAVTREGDCWKMGRHLLLCGDAKK